MRLSRDLPRGTGRPYQTICHLVLDCLRGDAGGMTRQDRRWLLGLFLGGLSLRLIHLATIRKSPFFLYLGLDPLAYHEYN